MGKSKLTKRDGFGSKIGVLAAATGSAIGLGNIWKFPYILGENGGGAFLVVYLICIALIGMPLLLSEFIIGRRGKLNPIGSFNKLSPGKPWWIIGLFSIASAFIILSYYIVIAGWVFAYIYRSLTGNLFNVACNEIGSYFDNITSAVGEPIFWAFIVLLLTALIIIGGVKNGIEKYSKLLMPILLIILIILMIHSLSLPGSLKGLSFMFNPDFSKLTSKSILTALGHAFFSLSVGMGTMITYGSYISKRENLPKMAVQVSILDTLIALMSGIVIFPTVFAFGLEPTSGPRLIFITLPIVFQSMQFGEFFETLFFLLIGIAALTSTISILEVIIAFITETYNASRKKAIKISVSIIFLISIPCSLSYGLMKHVTFLGKTFFDILDFTSSNLLLPIGGLFISIFVGFAMKKRDVIDECTNRGRIRIGWLSLFMLCIRIIAPVAIIIVLINGLN